MTDTSFPTFQPSKQTADPFAQSTALLSQLAGGSGQEAALLSGIGRQLRAQQETAEERRQQQAAGALAPQLAGAIQSTVRMSILDAPKYSAVFATPGNLDPNGLPTAQGRADLRAAFIRDGWEEGVGLDLAIDSALTPTARTFIERDTLSRLLQQGIASGMTPGSFNNMLDTLAPNAQVGMEGVIAQGRKDAQATFGRFEPPKVDLQTQIAQTLNQRAAAGAGAAVTPSAAPLGAVPTAAGAPGARQGTQVMPRPTGKFIVGPGLFKTLNVNPFLTDATVMKAVSETIPGSSVADFLTGKGPANVFWKQVEGLITWDADANRFEYDFDNANSAQRTQMLNVQKILTEMLPGLGAEFATQLTGQAAGGSIEMSPKRRADVGAAAGVQIPTIAPGHMSEALKRGGVTEKNAIELLGAEALFNMPQFLKAQGLDGIVNPTGLQSGEVGVGGTVEPRATEGPVRRTPRPTGTDPGGP